MDAVINAGVLTVAFATVGLLATALFRLDAKIDRLPSMAALDARFDQIEQRFVGVDQRFERVDQQFDRVDQRFDRMDQRFDRVDQRFERVDGRLSDIEVAVARHLEQHA